MAKIPPPPPVAGLDPIFNRWLIELISILNADGTVNGASVAGFPELQAQVAQDETNISALQVATAQQGGQIAQHTQQIAALNAEIAVLQANPVVRNGAGAPGGGLGNDGDWYLNTTGSAGSKLWLRLGGVWTAYL